MMGREDKDAAEIVLKAMEEDGVEMIRESSVEYVEKDSKNPKRMNVCCTVKGAENKVYNCDALLIATGRIPNVENMGLEKANVKYKEGKGVEINELMQTSNPNIYALGGMCFDLTR